MNDYFYLTPFTFFWHNSYRVLLYNSITGLSKVITVDNDINDLLLKLDDICSMYCVPIVDTFGHKQNVKSFVSEVEKNGYGGVVRSDTEVKPVILPPRPAILKKPVKTQDYLDLLKFITISLNGNNSIHPYTEQIPLNGEIPWEDLEKLLEMLPSTLNRLVITGSNPLMYTEGVRLFNHLKNTPFPKTILLSYESFMNHDKHGVELDDAFDLEVEIVMQYFEPNMEDIIQKSCLSNINIRYVFYIISEEEFEKVEIFSEKYDLNNIDVRPWFNGHNLRFFEENVFLAEEDIKSQHPTRREIFANQIINTNYFGKLTVLPDGKVYANVSKSSLGKIGDNLGELIKQEFVSGESWFFTRDMLEPCNRCLYRHFCPSPSDYEFRLGRNNLCNIDHD